MLVKNTLKISCSRTAPFHPSWGCGTVSLTGTTLQSLWRNYSKTPTLKSFRATRSSVSKTRSAGKPKAILATGVAKPIGPYSQGVNFGKLVFVSGTLPLNSEGAMVGDTIETQTEKVLENMGKVLKEAGSSYDKVLKTLVLLSDMSDFPAFNKVYSKYFTSAPLPARSTFAVKALPKNSLVEIECIAYK